MAERKRQTRGKYTARLQRQQALQPSRFQLRRVGRGAGGGAVGPELGLLNPPFVAVVAALVAVGLMTVHSITVVDTDYSFTRQCLGVGLGCACMLALWLFDYRLLERLFVPLLGLTAFLLILPQIPGIGVENNGASLWIKVAGVQLQPGEFAKPIAILMVAAYVARFGGQIEHGVDYLKCLGVVFLPFLLIAKEDLGSSLVILFSGLCILFIGGGARRWILITVAALALSVAGLLMANSILSTYTDGEVQLLQDYQMSRLLVFIDPDNEDYADDAYNLKQAQIAIGSGEISGKGWGNATQSTSGFVPEAATDFIFCVYAEQTGFGGCALLLGLYLLLMACVVWMAWRANCRFGSLVAAGVGGMWFFQIFENIGMDLGMMPITGIPLPFMSYGSSFMLASFVCVGLLMSVWSHRHAASL